MMMLLEEKFLKKVFLKKIVGIFCQGLLGFMFPRGDKLVYTCLHVIPVSKALY